MDSPAQVHPGKRLIRVNEVVNKVGKSRPAIYKMIRAREFPGPIPVSSRTVAWLESEVDEWIQSRIDMRDSKTAVAQ